MSPSVQPPTYIYNAAILDVHDGDTVHLDVDLGKRSNLKDQTFGFHVYVQSKRLHYHDHFRLYGINAPELGNPDGSGVAARQYLLSIVQPDGVNFLPLTVRSILAANQPEQEKYGRWLARLWLATEDPMTTPSINDRMLAAGHAVPYFGGTR